MGYRKCKRRREMGSKEKTPREGGCRQEVRFPEDFRKMPRVLRKAEVRFRKSYGRKTSARLWISWKISLRKDFSLRFLLAVLSLVHSSSEVHFP